MCCASHAPMWAMVGGKQSSTAETVSSLSIISVSWRCAAHPAFTHFPGTNAHVCVCAYVCVWHRRSARVRLPFRPPQHRLREGLCRRPSIRTMTQTTRTEVGLPATAHTRRSSLRKSIRFWYVVWTVDLRVRQCPHSMQPGPKWESSGEPLRITVGRPEKRSKFSGIKQFISYEVVAQPINSRVERRYKHFTWLHDRLKEAFPCVALPWLPEKHMQGTCLRRRLS